MVNFVFGWARNWQKYLKNIVKHSFRLEIRVTWIDIGRRAVAAKAMVGDSRYEARNATAATPANLTRFPPWNTLTTR